MGLFSKENISKGGDKEGKTEEKRTTGEEYDINKQTYIGTKSKIESRAHYALEPAWDTNRITSTTFCNCYRYCLNK